jgi:hypothetical protein
MPNGITVNSYCPGYPIPRIDEIIQKLGDSNYLSRVDLSKGFWQCELHEQSRAKFLYFVTASIRYSIRPQRNRCF